MVGTLRRWLAVFGGALPLSEALAARQRRTLGTDTEVTADGAQQNTPAIILNGASVDLDVRIQRARDFLLTASYHFSEAAVGCGGVAEEVAGFGSTPSLRSTPLPLPFPQQREPQREPIRAPFSPGLVPYSGGPRDFAEARTAVAIATGSSGGPQQGPQWVSSVRGAGEGAGRALAPTAPWRQSGAEPWHQSRADPWQLSSRSSDALGPTPPFAAAPFSSEEPHTGGSASSYAGPSCAVFSNISSSPPEARYRKRKRHPPGTVKVCITLRLDQFRKIPHLSNLFREPLYPFLMDGARDVVRETKIDNLKRILQGMGSAIIGRTAKAVARDPSDSRGPGPWAAFCARHPEFRSEKDESLGRNAGRENAQDVKLRLRERPEKKVNSD